MTANVGLWAVGSSAVSDHAEYKLAAQHALGAESLKYKQRLDSGLSRRVTNLEVSTHYSFNGILITE